MRWPFRGFRGATGNGRRKGRNLSKAANASSHNSYGESLSIGGLRIPPILLHGSTYTRMIQASQGRNPSKERPVEDTILAYHGGQQEDVHWLSTEHKHAEEFAAVWDEIVLYEVYVGDAIRIDVESHPDLAGVIGYDADDIVQDIMEREHVNVAILVGWESDGLDILVAEGWALERVCSTPAYTPRHLDTNDGRDS